MRPMFVLPLAGLVLLLALLFTGLWLNPREVPSPLIGKAAPSFDLPLLMQPEQRLSEQDLRGKVTLVNVWASWCVSCRVEHPLLVELASQDSSINIIGLNYKDEPRAARQWLAALGNPYAHSIIDRDGRTGIDWGVYGVPETFVVDREGVIRMKHIGPISPAALNERILPLVRELQGGSG